MIQLATAFRTRSESLFIDGKTELNINATVGAEVEFGSALQVEVLPGATLDVDGALEYNLTTFP
jgi:hypothetical protein